MVVSGSDVLIFIGTVTGAEELVGTVTAVEALVGVRLHKQNFRRLVERGSLVEGTAQLEPDTGGRPAELFRFRREVLHERPAPGVGLPGLPVGR